MDSAVTEESKEVTLKTEEDVSGENFQKNIYDLFEKNGVLHDLRAYLRGHIVNAIKCSKTGEALLCHKLFTQRLELTSQALNILIAEHLMRLEFNHSLTVFISEIPLANMVFDFAKTLMDRTCANEFDVRFTDNDVWSILNYLGLKCDSDHASRVVEMYKSDRQVSLLLCILKCFPMYRKQNIGGEHAVSSEEQESSVKSSDAHITKDANSVNKETVEHEKCKHLVYCQSCQTHLQKFKNKYKKKKKYLYKTMNTNLKPAQDPNIMKNIGVCERSLINEMFQQLKSVYETEVDMVKEEEEKRLKRSMAWCTLQLQRQRDELEESYKQREVELEQSISQRKMFLWGLARALREQHRGMLRAMHHVRRETDRLYAKEDSLKTQVEEAEQILKSRGEEMRKQITEELTVLETHLNSMKKERDCIHRERTELNSLKSLENTASNIIQVSKMDSEELRTHYDLLRNELALLKKYLDTSKLTPKCVFERGTITELSGVNSNVCLNNIQSADRKVDDFEDRLKNQVVNDLKKKNVNFTQCKLDELYRERSHSHVHSSASSEAGDAAPELRDRNSLQRLRQENSRLRAHARQQKCHIEALSRACARPPPPGPAYVSTPTSCPPRYFINRAASANIVNAGWRKGAGEELSVFTDVQPRILVPGDTIPFVGVLRDHRHNNRRQLLSQWRSLRGRVSLLPGVTKRMPTRIANDTLAGSSSQAREEANSHQATTSDDYDCTLHCNESHLPRPVSKANKHRDMSPKSVLKEAKQKLRNVRDTVMTNHPKSPNSVLKEAKQRLRKLEIEAEAVERSYLDFRRKQELRSRRDATVERRPDDVVSRDLDLKSSPSVHKLNDTVRNRVDVPTTNIQKSMATTDFDKYMRDYQTRFNIGETHFKTTHSIIKPIPEAYSKLVGSSRIHNENFLETPLAEFRKYYRSSRKPMGDDHNNQPTQLDQLATNAGEASELVALEGDAPTPESPKFRTKSKQKNIELGILRRNINKMYNLLSHEINPEINPKTEAIATEEINKLQIEVESPKSDEGINKLLIEVESPKTDEDINKLQIEVESPKKDEDINKLQIEVESTCDVKSEAQDLSLVVKNAIDVAKVSVAQPDSPTHGQVTIIVSPRDSARKAVNEKASTESSFHEKTRSLSPEQEARLTRNEVLDAIFQTDPCSPKVNNTENIAKDVILSDSEKKDDYPEDFSADVDNYNSRPESMSPISLIKTSEDENFWDV